MTFEEFQKTRTHCADLGEKLQDAQWEDAPVPGTGFIYLDALFIEDVQDHWPEAARKAGKHYLIIGRCDWVSDDLEMLERKLYEFAQSEGYLETPEAGGQ